MIAKVADTEQEKRMSYRLRFETMCRDLGWLPAQDYAVPEEKDEYDDGQSITFLAMDDEGSAVGTSRIIFPGEKQLPIEKHFELVARADIEKTHGKISLGAEVSRFIVPHHTRYKKHEITRLLCMALLRTLMGTGASHAYVSADHRFFRLLVMLGFNFTQIGEPVFYMGSKTVPGIVNLSGLANRLRDQQPGLYKLLMSEGDMVLSPSTIAETV